jgi:hypothetical protein
MRPLCSRPWWAATKNRWTSVGHFGIHEWIGFCILQVPNEASASEFRVCPNLGPSSTCRSRRWGRIRVRFFVPPQLALTSSHKKRVITTPTELIKIRQQNLLIPTKARLVLYQIFRESGIVGLFRGYTATCLRDCGYGPYFAVVSFYVL